jgi:hypothetical protein
VRPFFIDESYGALTEGQSCFFTTRICQRSTDISWDRKRMSRLVSFFFEKPRIIADNLSKGEWSWGYVSALDREGRTIWIADAHRGDGKRFVVRPQDKLTAFMELESAIRARGEFS